MCALFLLIALCGCVPKDEAVGDTWKPGFTVEHDGKDASNTSIVVVPPAQTSLRDDMQETNKKIFQALKQEGVKAYYANATDQKSQERAVKDAVSRKASLILIENMAKGDWNSTLQEARRAGVAVVLLGDGYQPQDKTLFAARIFIEDSPGAQPIGYVLRRVVDDRSHTREIAVHLRDSNIQNKLAQ